MQVALLNTKPSPCAAIIIFKKDISAKFIHSGEHQQVIVAFSDYTILLKRKRYRLWPQRGTPHNGLNP